MEKEIQHQIGIWNAQIQVEIRGDNIVKENFARGRVVGLKQALCIIQDHASQQAVEAGRAGVCGHKYTDGDGEYKRCMQCGAKMPPAP